MIRGWRRRGEAAMARIICIFSDGTGQAGGANPIDWTNVYRLYVNARTQAGQICFYDPGIGSDPERDEEDAPFSPFAGLLAKALGAGIARNIVDCYAALLLSWKPGDRVFLFGFSRGAYTVRSLAGAMALCGVPPGLPKLADGGAIRSRIMDKAVRAIADEAVGSVYMTYDDPALRQVKAAEFREKHGSEPLAPFFIGAWDTVRALGWQVTDIARFGRHRFHDSRLNPKVDHGRQALSIDENRKVFSPELWDERGAPQGQIEQRWMAGAHADIGGGYGLRLGLTDIAMKWMVGEAMAARDRVADPVRTPGFQGFKVDPNLLAELNLDPLGPQHDERASPAGWLWWPGTREAYADAPELQGPARTGPELQPRFEAQSVPIDGRQAAYRPEAMRRHPEYGGYYGDAASPAAPEPGGG
jgi:uncharacterized protein (DUF2235 family)